MNAAKSNTSYAQKLNPSTYILESGIQGHICIVPVLFLQEITRDLFSCRQHFFSFICRHCCINCCLVYILQTHFLLLDFHFPFSFPLLVLVTMPLLICQVQLFQAQVLLLRFCCTCFFLLSTRETTINFIADMVLTLYRK